MATSSSLCYTLFLLLICKGSAAPLSASKGPDPLCSTAQLIAPGQGSLVYQYKTEVQLAVANSQFDLKTEITATVNIQNLGDCDYALQLRNVKVAESNDQDTTTVTSTAKAQKELENIVVRFRWVDGFVVMVEADSSAKVDHINFIKGIVSALQVYSPAPADNQITVREEDVLGVCTTQYKFSQKSGSTKVTKTKDLSTCSKDRLHLSSSPVLTSLLGPVMEELFMAKTNYVCQTAITDKKVQSVKCKTIDMDAADKNKALNKDDDDNDDSSEEKTDDDDSNDEENDEISPKLISIKQELTLQTSGASAVNENAIRNPVRQTLQFVPTASFDQSNEAVSSLVSKIQALLKTADWNEFASAQFVDIANELRRMDLANVEAFKAQSELKHMVPTFLNTIYAHDPATSLLNLDTRTLKFANPLAVFYLDKPSSDLVNRVVEGARALNAEQALEFVGIAARILKTYKARQDNVKDANAKIKEFHQAISKFLQNPSADDTQVITAVLAAYAQLGLYDDQLRTLATNDQLPLQVQYQVLNAIRHIDEDYVNAKDEFKIRSDLQTLLLSKLQNTANKNAVRVWAFEALYTSFIYNPEEADSTLGDNLEKALSDLLNQPLDQVNGYIWSVLKYSSLDRLCPLRGLAARLRAHHDNKKQFAQQSPLSSRHIQIELPLRKNFEAVFHLSAVFENDRVVPSFISVKLAFDGIRRETLRLPWIDAALVIENLDWNFADYFLRMDPMNKNKNNDEEEKTRVLNSLPADLKEVHEKNVKEEDPDPSVYLYLKLFGADVRTKDVTNKVQDMLRTNIRTFIRNQILNRLKDLAGKNPIFRIPLEIGAASAAANGLTLYKAAQIGVLADLSTELKNNRDNNGLGTYSMISRSSLSFSLTLQREVSSPLTTIGETVQLGIQSDVPFEYSAVASEQGRVREFNLLNPTSKLLSMDFQYGIRNSKGFQIIQNKPFSGIDPSCTPSFVYRGLGIQACLALNPFRSIELGRRPSYPITITVSKDASIKKWRIGWRFNANDAPQYEVAVEKVGATASYPGLGVSATVNGNNFDIKFLTGMKSFTVKGSKSGNSFSGSVYSSDNKEVMTTSGTLIIDNDSFKLNGKVVDISSKKEVLALTTNILPNRGKGLTLNIGLTTPDNAKSFKINFRGDLYKPDSKLVHINGGFTLGDMSYNGKANFERDADHTRIELGRVVKFSKASSQAGYEFLFERTTTKDASQISHDVTSHVSVRAPTRDEPIKVINLKSSFTRKNDLSSTELHSALDFVLMSRDPPTSEKIELDYVRSSVRTKADPTRLISPEGSLKIQVKTKSNIFNFLLDHRHRISAEASKKGPSVLPPTVNVYNKFHVVADTDRLLPDIPRPFAFDILSEVDLEFLNRLDYKFQYEFRRRQRSGSFTFKKQITDVMNGHLFSGPTQFELQLDNKMISMTGTGNAQVCMQTKTLKAHWDINTNLVPDKNDMELDINIRVDRQPVKNSPKSLALGYYVMLKAPKHSVLQLIDIDGNLTKQMGKFETFNSIAYRKGKIVKEANLNFVIFRNQTGDSSLKAQVSFALPFKYIPYVSYNLKFDRNSPNGGLRHLESKLIAKPVLAHYAKLDIDRSKNNDRPYVTINNEFEYLRGNGDYLLGVSKIDVQRWSAIHSMGVLKRNTDLLHKHSVGYIFSSKTRKVALSLQNPLISSNPLSIIGELTIDKENRIGKMNWPQEFGLNLEFGTPISNLTALHVFYNLPMFNKNNYKTVDATVGFKLASVNVAPIGFYLHSEGSLNTTLHVLKSFNIGNDIALATSLTAKYNPQLFSQISSTITSKFYGQEFQNSLYALFKKHKVIVRGMVNTTDNQDFKYDLDIGFDNDLLTGHMERTDGNENTVSDIEAQKCTPAAKYNRCYKGDITVQAAGSTNKGTFDVSWGRETAKLGVKIPNYIELNLDHTHNGRLRDEDFSSQTDFNGKVLQSNKKGSFSYSGLLKKVDGKWNDVQVRSTVNDMKTGQKSVDTDLRLKQQITDKLKGQFQRKLDLNLEYKGQPLITWSSDAVSCERNPSSVVYGLCETATFNVKASNRLAQRLRQRFELSTDSTLADQSGQVTYDGKLNLDLKHDPALGPHTLKLDLNRMKQDAVDVDLIYQPRSSNVPMSINLKASLPKQNPIAVKYDETPRSATNFLGVLKYSFNANDNSAEKTYQCDVDRPDVNDFSINCKGERTTLTIDVDRKAGRSKAYVDLNRFTGERVGYEVTRDPSTQAFDGTFYTFVSSWNIKRRPGVSTILTVKQKDQEVLRVEAKKIRDGLIQTIVTPANVYLSLEYDMLSGITLTQTYPQRRNIASISIDSARIRRYLPSLRNQNRPANDIDDQSVIEQKPLFEIALDNTVLLSVSQALAKLGSHNGLYGLDTVKKVFKVQIGDAPLTIYSIQHWKTHLENFELPESYTIRIVNNANGNMVQLATHKWNEHRLISSIGHSFDGGKTLTTDLKVDRNYAYQVGSMYFLQSFAYRNIQGAKQLRNYTQNFVYSHLMKDLNKTSAAELAKTFRGRIRSILEKDYAAVKEIVTSWTKESENSVLRRLAVRLEVLEFFEKYPTYTEASDRLFALLRQRTAQRQEFWRSRFETIASDNRLQDLSKRIQARREELIRNLLERAEKFLDRFVPSIDQKAVDDRIAAYIRKLLAGFKKSSQTRTTLWKSIFKAIDEASKGEDNKWFRTLIADIDSDKLNAAIDAESEKTFKKLDQSSALFIRNIQQFSQRMNQRREAFRERVRNAIRHLPKLLINETNVEVLIPVGRRPRTNTRASEMMLAIGSLLRNRDQAIDTIRSVILNRLQTRFETPQIYYKVLQAIAKRLFKRNPSLTPEFNAIIANTGDAIDLHGHYIYLNPQCNYVLAHDFGGLQFSFRFANGKFYSSIPNQSEIGEYKCSNTGRIQLCNQGYYATISVPMYYGGLVDGALGDVRDRSGNENKGLTSWILGQCPDAASAPSKVSDESIPECFNFNDDQQQFCENFVRRGLQKGLNKRLLVLQANAAEH